MMSHRTDWKGAVVVALSLAILGLGACGSSGGAVSHLSKRAFVSDNFDGTLHIEDAATDVESGFTIATGNQPGAMVLSPDKTITLVFDAADFQLAVVSNSLESTLGRITVPNVSTGYAAMSDNTVGFVAVPNCPLASCGGFSNVVEVVDIFTNFDITGTVNVALDTTTMLYVPLNVATTLLKSPTDSKLLLFGGPADHQDTFTVIDTGLAETTPATAGTLMSGAAFDKPVSGVFSADGTKAYILNCGAECGGTAASVTVVDLTTIPPTVGTPIPVVGATTGLLNGSTLYVAGSPPGAGCAGSITGTSCGRLQTIDTGTLTASAPVVISDGFHNHMELASNNKLFIGATPICTTGCLTIYDTSANTAVVDSAAGNVTGIAPISERSVVYVIEDLPAGSSQCTTLPCLGELQIYDASASVQPTLTPTQIDVVGRAVDVKYIDK
ncbi:MAG: hypothetical protein ACLP2H_08235 [Terriglobales bacterium]